MTQVVSSTTLFAKFTRRNSNCCLDISVDNIILSTMVAAVVTEDETLPDFFPRVVKLCVKPSNAFFQCISEKSVKESNSDVEAGNRGIRACLNEKKLYETCMLKHDPKMNDPKRHRVGIPEHFSEPFNDSHNHQICVMWIIVL